jgi:NarL family two-component system response regulator LiaR
VAENLTPREQEVLTLMAKGLSNPEIAERLTVSPVTVKFHVSNILSKLGCASRTEAVALAIHRNLIS